MDLISVTSRQLHDAPGQRIGGKVKSYANASNNVGHDKLTAAGFRSLVPTVALNNSDNANVSSRREPGGNANSKRVERGNGLV